MRKVYERPEAKIVSFQAMEQIALLPKRDDPSTDVGGAGPQISGGVTGREEFDW